MKVLLTAINAKYIHSNLAIYDLKAYAKELPVQVELGEYTINQLPEEILRRIYEERADVVAFSCYIWNISMVLSVAEELHKVAPHIHIWLGGPEASYDAAELLKKAPYVELVMVGEGEETFYDLLQRYLLQEENLLEIAGITYRDMDSNEIVQNPLRPYLDMDSIPFVYEDTMAFAHKIIYYETSRGCPFRCSYCLSSIDKRVRFRSLSLVLPELKHFLDEQVPQVKFVDRTFNCKHDHAYAIWKYILENDNGITNFHFEISSDLLQEEDFILFEKMRPGLIQLEIGVQSTYPETIEAIQRTMNLSKVRANVARIQKMNNIHQHLDLIAGLPYETLNIFRQSFNDVYHMYPNQLQLGFLKVLKGSYMEEHKEEYGILYTSKPPYEVLSTRWLSYEEVLELKGIEEMVEIYYNSGQFLQSICYLLPFYKDAFTFYQEFAVYYKENNLLDRKHTRLARYDILRQFAMETVMLNPKMVRIEGKAFSIHRLDEYLIYDLYITEHCKKRPAWALQNSGTKELLNQLRNTAWRSRYLSAADNQAVTEILKNRTDVHLEYFPETMQKQYLLFDYSRRQPLTNHAVTVVLDIKTED